MVGRFDDTALVLFSGYGFCLESRSLSSPSMTIDVDVYVFISDAE